MTLVQRVTLSKEVGYYKDASNNAEKPIGTDVIVDPTDYTFSVTNGGAYSDSQTIENQNVFKHDPGFAGIVTDGDGDPVPGVTVEIYSPTGSKLATVTTDVDGFYFFSYKHTGKEAIFTVKLPAYGLQQSVTLKANKFAMVDFTVP